MNKATLYVAAIATALLTFLAGFTATDGKQASLGQEAPTVIATRAFAQSDSLSAPLAHLHGRPVVLSFWSSSDAPSRLDQNIIAQAASEGSRAAGVVSVNFDSSTTLFSEIVRLDGLDASAQWHVDPSSSAAAALVESYRMERGLRTFLIDAQGMLVAADPTPEQIRAFINAGA